MIQLDCPTIVQDMKIIILLYFSIVVCVIGCFFLLRTAFMLLSAGQYGSAFITFPIDVLTVWLIVFQVKVVKQIVKDRYRKK